MASGERQQAQDHGDSLVGAAAVARSMEDLAQLLRTLRRRHARANRDSSLTYRELAARIGWSQTAVAEYFTASTLPPTDRFDALVEVLGATPVELRALADARDRVEETRRRAKYDRAEPETDSPAADKPSSGPAPATMATRQLPAGTALFTGRAQESAKLLELAAPLADGRMPGVATVFVIDGIGGVGKTALAIHAGHLLASRYPDGQLFLDLYGFAEERPPRDPGEALAELLGSLGVPPKQIPEQRDARAALYRDRLSGTRTLVLLDNAADEAQIRPLLPPAGCLALVTSRRRLRALDDAVPLPLDVLPQPEAVELVRKAARAHSDGEEADDRWEACNG
jgi:transcriptional regulator with XRE-family HTH domain